MFEGVMSMLRYTILFLGLTGCEVLPASGDPLAPAPQPKVVVPAAAVPVPASVPTTAIEPVPATDPNDLDADLATDTDEGEIPEDPEALLAMMHGEQPDAAKAEEIPPEVPPSTTDIPLADDVFQPDEPAIKVATPQEYAWDPATAPASPWGVHLLNTINTMNPPQAVIGLADGSKRVVAAGDMLPEQQLVVMAVGRNVVQVSHIVPGGYQARVETSVLSALYPSN